MESKLIRNGESKVMQNRNEMRMSFDARSVNEGFARVVVAAFIAEQNPTLEELADIKTAVSEAVTNAIIHGYENGNTGKDKCENLEQKVVLSCRLIGNELEVTVEDKGKGIADIARAMEPFFTTKPELERSGMGFSFMEAFMDEVRVVSAPGMGTSVFMRKKIGVQEGSR